MPKNASGEKEPALAMREGTPAEAETGTVPAENGAASVEAEKEMFDVLPVLPLNHLVGMPGDSISFTLQNPELIKLVQTAHREDKCIFTYCPAFSRQSGQPVFGTLARIADLASDGNLNQLKFKLQFERRAELVDLDQPRLTGRIRTVERGGVLDRGEEKAILAEIEAYFQELSSFTGSMDGVLDESGLDNPDELFARTARHIKLSQKDKAELLCGWSRKRRLDLFLQKLAEQVQVFRYRKQLQNRTSQRIQQLERDSFLQEEKRLIESELGRGRPAACPPEFQELQDKLKAFEGPDAIKALMDREFTRLCRSGMGSPQSAMIQDYLEVVLELPWSREAAPEKDWNKVERSLEDSHFGLEKVKKRILEHLAVIHLAPKSRGVILCFVGPPGVGKTSMARAIADSLALPFVKKSLGGVHDECEIRGHRRTYIGALPGRIIQGLRKAGCKNPLFLLDEVDKMGRDHRGSPADALLEVLDQDENSRFSDHYLEQEFDLSKVFWVLTANSQADIPEPLRDRLEIINFSGYTEQEKMNIAKGYLLRRNLDKLGLDDTKMRLSDELCRSVIRGYTREAGVRELDRKISELIHHRALDKVRSDGKAKWVLLRKNVRQALGPLQYKHSAWRKSSWKPGVVAGLAWTPAGGSILRLECCVMPGKNTLKLTGKMGEVMQESAHIACSFIRRNSGRLSLDPKIFEQSDLHIHIPAGAVSKEGPSAGLGLALLIYSALSKKRSRPYWAVTGEMALHGIILPVGGIKEKILAAQQDKFEGVVLPAENEQDVEEISRKDLGRLRMKYVSNFWEALDWMFP